MLNMITRKIDIKHTVVLSFNPWIFSDRNSMMANFFSRLAKQVDKSLDGKAKKIGKFLKTYSDSLFALGDPVVELDQSGAAPAAAKSVKYIIDRIARDDIKKQKDKIDKIMRESRKKFVIIIDDIDRLDKEELFTLLKIVKLNANFPKTIFLLALDPEIVAQAISSRVGDGSRESGLSYLEKIIQVPLRLPKFHKKDLVKYLREKVDSILKELKIEPELIDQEKLEKILNLGVLPRLTTPRLAINYYNSLSFALSMLMNESSPTDVIGIEAIKIFYPDLYMTIKNNEDLFTLKDSVFNFNQEETKKKTIEVIDTLKSKFNNEKCKDGVLAICCAIFPNIDRIISNYRKDDISLVDQYRNKSICHEAYFHRYFTYSVHDTELSDTRFREFMTFLRSQDSIDTISKSLAQIKQKYTYEEYVHKLRDYIYKCNDYKTLEKIAELSIREANNFNLDYQYIKFSSDFHLSLDLITKVLMRVAVDKASELFLQIIINAPSLRLKIKALNELHAHFGDTRYNRRRLSEAALKECKEHIVKESLKVQPDANFIRSLGLEARSVYSYWYTIDKDSLQQSVSEACINDPSILPDLVNNFTRFTVPTAEGDIPLGDISYNDYANFQRLFDADTLINIANTFIDEDDEEAAVFKTMRHDQQTRSNLMKQLITLHKRYVPEA